MGGPCKSVRLGSARIRRRASGNFMAQRSVTAPGIPFNAAQLSTLLDASSELIGFLDADGVLQFANATFRSVLGYHPEELLGRSIYSIVHASDVQHVRAQLAEVMQ